MKVLSLTDHDTMTGIPEAVEAGRRFGIKIIPGIEISTLFGSRYLLSYHLCDIFSPFTSQNIALMAV